MIFVVPDRLSAAVTVGLRTGVIGKEIPAKAMKG